MKDLHFSLSLVDGALVASGPAENYDISQYQVVRIVADADPTTMYPEIDLFDISISLHLMGPNIAWPSSPTMSSYPIKIHLIPDLSVPNRFYCYLNETLGNQMSVGALNKVYYCFEAYLGNATYSQAISSSNAINLYKTNLDCHYSPDDFSNLFVAMDAMKDELTKLEG